MVSPEEQVMTMRTASLIQRSRVGWSKVPMAKMRVRLVSSPSEFSTNWLQLKGTKPGFVVVSVLGGVVVGSDVDLLPVKLGSHQPSRALEL